MILLQAMGCAWLRYEPVLVPTRPPPSDSVAEALVAERIDHGLVVRAHGARVSASDLPESVAWATWLYASRRARGGEFDLVVNGLNVEIVRARTGETDVRWAARNPPAPALPPAAIRFVDGTAPWSELEKGLVGPAFHLVDPAVIPWVSDVELWRGVASPRRPRSELSWYDPRADPPRIEFFDQAFEDEAFGFAGAPDAPVGIATTTMLHELGHALADAEARRAYAAYVADFAAGADVRSSWRAFRDALRADTVVSSFRAVWDRPGPTPYSRGRVHEAFAESFFLFYADSAALERVQPRVFAWFEEQGPLAALKATD